MSRHHRRGNNKSEVSREEIIARIDEILLYGTFALLMFGPIAFGAVEPWSIFFVETGAVLLTLTWLAKQWLNEQIVIIWNPLFLPMGVFAALILIQIVLKLSAYPHDTISGAMLYCAYGLLCFLATQILRRSSQARKVALILASFGFAVAVFSLVQGVAPNGKLYWLRVPRLGGSIYGPYVNRNHYAGLMELLAPIPLVISLSHLVQEKVRIAAGVAAAVMVGTIFLSGSRGGMLAILVELGVFAAVLFREKRSIRIAISLTAFTVVLVGLLAWLGGRELTSRVGSISTETRGEISGGMRLSIDRDVVRMFRDKPILGWGLGTFPVVYPKFRSFYTNFFVNEAHNDYAQLMAEMGLVGFCTLVWYMVILYRQIRRKLGKWTTDVSSAVTLACALGVIGILVHSLVDFNLQIPANAALFYVLATIAAAPPLQQRAKKPRPVPAEEEDPIPASEVV